MASIRVASQDTSNLGSYMVDVLCEPVFSHAAGTAADAEKDSRRKASLCAPAMEEEKEEEKDEEGRRRRRMRKIHTHI